MRREDTERRHVVMTMGKRRYGRSIYFIYLWVLSKDSDISDQQARCRGKLSTNNMLLEEHQHDKVANHQGHYIGYCEGMAHVTCGVSKYQTERGLVDIPSGFTSCDTHMTNRFQDGNSLRGNDEVSDSEVR
jgi:hypothetical protein